MKNMLQYVLIGLVIFVINYFFDVQWWFFAIPCIIVGALFPFKPKSNVFVIGFVSGALTFLIQWLIVYVSNDGRMLHRLSVMFDFHEIWIVLASCCIGGVVSGLSVFLGNSLFQKKQPLKLEE